MKRIIIGAMGLMFIATPIYAQTVEPTLQDQYVQALQTVIGLLQQEVSLLVAQLKSISDNQATITNQLSTIQQNNIPAPIMAGGIPETPAPVVVMTPAPTCTLVASTTDPESFVGSFGWTSTNATRGTIYFRTKDWNTAANLAPASGGYLDGIGFSMIPNFEARFVGAGGETTCTTTLQITQ